MVALSPARTARRALLAAALWVGFWLLALALAGGLAWVPFTQAAYAGGPDLGGLLAGAGAVVVLWALRPRGWFANRKASEHEPLGAEQFPALHALVEEVARKVGTRPPRKVMLSEAATAYIYMERRWLGLRREPVVGIGLPLFALLTRDELAAVIAHEYGHHVGGDLSLGPWVYRTRSAIASAVDSLQDSAFFLDVPFRAYGQLFLRVSSAVSRQQELAADALSATTCGAAPSARALRKVHTYGPAWQVYLEQDAIPFIEMGARVPLLEGFRRFLAWEPRRAEVTEALHHLANQPPSPWDSHPPLEARLRTIGAEDAASVSPGPGCLELLGGEASAEDVWYSRFIRGELRPVGWDEVAARTLLPHIAQRLAGISLSPRQTPPAALPALLSEGAALWDRLRPSGLDLLSPEAKRQRARALLADWLAGALEQRGFQAALSPGGNLRMSREGETVEPVELIEGLASGRLSSEQYLTWCEPLPSLPDEVHRADVA